MRDSWLIASHLPEAWSLQGMDVATGLLSQAVRCSPGGRHLRRAARQWTCWWGCPGKCHRCQDPSRRSTCSGTGVDPAAIPLCGRANEAQSGHLTTTTAELRPSGLTHSPGGAPTRWPSHCILHVLQGLPQAARLAQFTGVPVDGQRPALGPVTERSLVRTGCGGHSNLGFR